jgi:hypothetical protein
MNQEELSIYIEKTASQLQSEKKNLTIDKETFSRSVIGMLIGIFAGFVLTAAQLLLLGGFLYWTIVVVFFVSLSCIKMFTNKNAGNIIVFTCALVATVTGPAFAHLVFYYLQNGA